MKTSTRLATLAVVLIILSARLASGQDQQLPTKIGFSAPSVINFTELANYEKAHPAKLRRQRFVEQGEDRERPVTFNNAVPENAEVFKFQIDDAVRTVSPAPTATFNGVMDNGTLIPPDIRGAAGPNHIMETTNQEFKIYSKTGTLVSTLSINTFFSGSGGSGFFDPHIAYDPSADRWMVAIDGNVVNGDGGIFLAISQTSDPTGSWYRYGIDGIGNTTDFLDYPLLGFNANWIVVTGNVFLSTSNVGKVYVFNKANLYAGLSGYVNTFTSTSSYLIAPATTYDANVTTEYMVANWNGNSGGNGYVKLYTLTGTPDAPVFNSGNTVGVNQPWSGSSVNAPQLNSSRLLEDGDTRIGNAVYMNGALWFCHTVFLPVSSPNHAAVDWWQVNPSTSSVMQFGRIDNSPTFNFYPSIAVNTNNDALIGYSQSSSSMYPSAAYSFRAGSDPVNTVQSGYLFKSGVAAYYKTYGGSRNRWGDYSGTAYDPSTGGFFTFQEWANTNNNWATVIASVPGAIVAPVCAAPNGTSTSGITDTTASFGWTGVAGAMSYNIQYRVVGTTTWTLATSGTNSYVATTLAPGTAYEWQVQTVCVAASSSSFTASTNFTTTNANAVCNAPVGTSTSAITNTSATFNWSAVAGATGYNVQYRQIGIASWTSATSTATSYTASGLSGNTAYEWQVKTVCSNGTSLFTASANFTTTNTPACTESLEPNNSKSTAATIATNTDVVSQISTSTDNDWFRFTTTSAQPNVKITLTGLPADYDLRLYNSSGNSLLAISQNTGTTDEAIIRNTASAATYKIKVNGYSGAFSSSQCYTLHVYTGAASFAPVGNQYLLSDTKKSDVAIYPNPANDEVNVSFNSDEDGDAQINVYDMLGKLVMTTTQQVTIGTNVSVLGTADMERGVYLIEVNNDGETLREKLTIAH